MATYEKCPDSVHNLAMVVIGQHHADLRDAGVTIDCVFARARRNKYGDPVGPALKLHGRTCAATVKVNDLKKRALGLADAVITIDGDNWEKWTDRQREALMDHELTHLLVQAGKHTRFKTDDLSRPVLRTRHHDWELTGFQSIVDRYGEDSFEAMEMATFVDQYGQHCFGFAEPSTSKTKRRRAS